MENFYNWMRTSGKRTYLIHNLRAAFPGANIDAFIQCALDDKKINLGTGDRSQMTLEEFNQGWRSEGRWYHTISLR